ncbi:hypothetical protein SKDZ_14G3230 [Saccharomyces kudriavzevii ZP591]|nr:hypothetical protein SKDZ_14G3230 [Saccharomyces kudriavzevii ZP591]
MTDLYNDSTLENLLDGLTDLNRIPKEYSPLLEPYFQNIANNTHLKFKALKICRFNFHKWNRLDSKNSKSISPHCKSENDKFSKAVDPEVIRRCLNLWYVLRGKEYKKLKNPPSANNIIKDEVDVSNIKGLNFVRLEFDEFGKSIRNPLNNLILEEVEVNDFLKE